MKFLVIGLGSMGKRRIRNLQKLNVSDIVGFDPRKDRRDEATRKYGITTFSELEMALDENPQAMIISTPPNLHEKYANIAIKKNIHFFTEVNLSSKEISRILNKINRKSIIAVPSCTLLFHPIVKELKKLIKKNSIGKILTVTHHFGFYLPYWHPWEDYKKFYVSKKETGAAKEIVPFELIWLMDLFSDVSSVNGNVSKISSLDVNIDDVYHGLIKFRNGILCNLTVDVFSKPAFRDSKIIGENGSILCDFNLGVIKIYKQNKWKTLKFDLGKVQQGYKGNTGSEPMYEEEIKNFINAINKKISYPFTFRDELKALKVLDAIELSAKNHKNVKLKK